MSGLTEASGILPLHLTAVISHTLESLGNTVSLQESESPKGKHHPSTAGKIVLAPQIPQEGSGTPKIPGPHFESIAPSGIIPPLQ